MAGFCSSDDQWSEAPDTCLMGLLSSSYNGAEPAASQPSKPSSRRPLEVQESHDDVFDLDISPRTLTAVLSAHHAPALAAPRVELDEDQGRDQARLKPRFFRSVLPIEG
jgi:hypothetical protein